MSTRRRLTKREPEPTPSGRHLPAHQLREVAVASGRDPRTVARFLRGLPVRGLAAAAIARALTDLGLAEPEEKRVA